MRKSDLRLAGVISELIDCNPFEPRRTELELKALGKSFNERDADWTLNPAALTESENLVRLETVAEELLARLAKSFDEHKDVSEPQSNAYRDVAYYLLFSRFRDDFRQLAANNAKGAGQVFSRFEKQFAEMLDRPQLPDDILSEAPHMFALLFQLFRAFHNLFDHILGGSPATIALRASVWQSIFTCDLRRYRSSLYQRMTEFSTLVTGPSGSGKELVARAVGLSGYIPWDVQKKRFATECDQMFCSLNLTALNPSLIESDLFGHRKGAFTGADRDRIGWLETCPEFGTVFLDEIGELDESIQVKLLRVLQEREFLPVGGSDAKPFRGRIVAATNRDLQTAVDERLLREDFVYRICSDHIRTPSLAQRCAGSANELQSLVQHSIRRMTGEDDIDLVNEILTWIHERLGSDYAWPGNVRELEQCVRSYLLRKEYVPITAASEKSPLHEGLDKCELTADELLTTYCTVIYSRTRNYVATARQLGLDRRTVKAHIDEQLLAKLR